MVGEIILPEYVLSSSYLWEETTECNDITQKRKQREGGILSVIFPTTIIRTGEQMVQPLESRR